MEYEEDKAIVKVKNHINSVVEVSIIKGIDFEIAKLQGFKVFHR